MKNNYQTPKPRILNITVVRNLTAGQRQQLEAEVDAAESLGLDWETLAFHNASKLCDFEYSIPSFFKPLFLRNIFCWYFMLKHKNDYDYILQRHMMFDPFVFLFSWFIPNRITIHHSMEIEELQLVREGWKGTLASALERISGKVNVYTCKAIVGVTPEIADYQLKVHGINKPSFFYANGIDLKKISLLNDSRCENEIHAAFICGTFSTWHGLDLLIEASKNIRKSKFKIYIHLIGNLTPVQKTELKKILVNCEFISYGHLNKVDYLNVLSRCDFGITSLALFRKGLNEASTLKVREYLAMGLPVITSKHVDPAFPADFEFFKNIPMVDFFKLLIENKVNNVQRQDVRNKAQIYIDKKSLVSELYDHLSKL